MSDMATSDSDGIRDSGSVPSYIGKCPTCGGMAMAVVDDGTHKDMVARELAKAARRGLVIERVTCQWVREHSVWCKCHSAKKGKPAPAPTIGRMFA